MVSYEMQTRQHLQTHRRDGLGETECDIRYRRGERMRHSYTL